MSLRHIIRCTASAAALVAALGCSRYVVTGGERCSNWLMTRADTTQAPTPVGSDANRIIGRVTSLDYGTPLNFARIELVSPILSRSAQGDSSGVFVLDSVPPGEYLVRVRRLAYTGAELRIAVEAGRGDTLRMALRGAPLDGPCQISKLPWWKLW